MSWIVKKFNGIYEYRWKEQGIRKSKSLRTKDLDEANKLKQKYDLLLTETNKATDLDFELPKVNIRYQIEIYLQTKTAEIKVGSLKRYRQMSNNFLQFCNLKGITIFNELSSSVISQYIVYRAEQNSSNRTTRDELALLKSVIKYAVEEEILDKDPIRKWPKIKRIPKKPERLGSYALEEIGKLLDYCKLYEKEFYPVFLFAVYSGCRFGELKHLKIKNLDLNDNTVIVFNQKTGSDSNNIYSKIRVPQQVMQAIAYGKSEKKDLYVFPQIWSHNVNWCRQVLIKVCKRLNIQYRRFHGTRHTYITTGLNAGIPTMYMQNQARHSKLSTTDRYAHSQMIPQELVELIRYPHEISK